MYFFESVGFNCVICGMYARSGVRLDNGDRICNDCYRIRPFKCVKCGKYFPQDLRGIENPDRYYCRDCEEEETDNKIAKEAARFAREHDGYTFRYLLKEMDEQNEPLEFPDEATDEKEYEIPWDIEEVYRQIVMSKPTPVVKSVPKPEYEAGYDYSLISNFDPYGVPNNTYPYSVKEKLREELNAESFLHEMGYSASESEWWRHHILERAIRRYGWNPVIRHLQFLLRLHANNSVMNRVYHIWEEDYEYIKNLSI